MKTHRDKVFINTCFTHLQGVVDADFATLTKIFGPCEDAGFDQVDWQWTLLFDDGEVATIYNWKNGPNYTGNWHIKPEDIKEWHVGGHTPKAHVNVLQTIARWKKENM